MSVDEGRASGAEERTGRPGVPRSSRTCLAVVALLAAGAGQFCLRRRPEMLLAAGVCFGISVLLFLLLALSVEGSQGGRPAISRKAEGWIAGVCGRFTPRLVLVAISMGLVLLTLGTLRGKTDSNYWGPFALWVGSGTAYAAAFLRIGTPRVGSWWRENRLDVILAGLLTMCAGFARFLWLGQVPAVISGDEGVIGLLMKDVLHGDIRNMLATSYGHGTLYLFSMAAFSEILNRTDAFALRFTSALAGTLTVPLLYAFARRFFGRPTAIIAAALLAFSHIHVHFSRIIVAGSIQDALFATLIWYLFLSGLDSRSRNRLVLSGLVLGVFLYVYMGARLTAALIPLYTGVLWFTNRRCVRENLVNLLLFLGAVAVVASPMAHWALQHPDEFNARLNQTGIFQSGWLANEVRLTGKSELALLARQCRDAFLSVIHFPATAFYNSRRPMLDVVSGAVFILGLAYTVLQLRRKECLLLHAWFWSSVMASALVVSPGVAAYRILVVLPAACVLVAVGWDRLIVFSGIVAAQPWRQFVCVAVIVAVTASLNVKYYFVDYAFACDYEDPMTRFASYMGEYYGRMGTAQYKAYLLGAPRINYGIHRSVDFFTGKTPIEDIRDPLRSPPADSVLKRPAVFFSTPDRRAELQYIRQALPGGKDDVVLDCGKPLLYIYVVR